MTSKVRYWRCYRCNKYFWIESEARQHWNNIRESDRVTSTMHNMKTEYEDGTAEVYEGV